MEVQQKLAADEALMLLEPMNTFKFQPNTLKKKNQSKLENGKQRHLSVYD